MQEMFLTYAKTQLIFINPHSFFEPDDATDSFLMQHRSAPRTTADKTFIDIQIP